MCTKSKFSTEAEAEAALYHIKRVRRKYKREVRPTRYYFCDMCRYYHLTSKEAFPEEIKLIHKDKFIELISKPP